MVHSLQLTAEPPPMVWPLATTAERPSRNALGLDLCLMMVVLFGAKCSINQRGSTWLGTLYECLPPSTTRIFREGLDAINRPAMTHAVRSAWKSVRTYASDRNRPLVDKLASGEDDIKL